MRSPCIETREQPSLTELENKPYQQQRLSTVKKKYKNKKEQKTTKKRKKNLLDKLY